MSMHWMKQIQDWKLIISNKSNILEDMFLFWEKFVRAGILSRD